jgi:hypothetical protein
VLQPDAKRELLQLIFERVWLDDGRIIAVRPKEAFGPFFLGRQHKTAGKTVFKGRERRGSIREFTHHGFEIRL